MSRPPTTRRAITEWFRREERWGPVEINRTELARMLGLPPSTVRHVFVAMERDGTILRHPGYSLGRGAPPTADLFSINRYHPSYEPTPRNTA